MTITPQVHSLSVIFRQMSRQLAPSILSKSPSSHDCISSAPRASKQLKLFSSAQTVPASGTSMGPLGTCGAFANLSFSSTITLHDSCFTKIETSLPGGSPGALS